MDPIFYYLLLIVTGLISGFVNTLAGGGSNLTIPALMVMGMPADIANATNRVAVLVNCLVGTAGFRRHGKTVGLSDALPIMGITVAGGLLGALAASFLPNLYLKPVLLSVMIGMALIILIRPSIVAPLEGTSVKKLKDSRVAGISLFIAGVYGGFVQAGVGFLLIGTIAGTLRYDLVRTNALKMMCVLAFTSVALIVFIWRDQINWWPALVLAAGTMVGSQLSVKVAVNASQTALKWFLFLMTLAASAAALFA